MELPQLWTCLEPRRTIARRVFANAAPRSLFKIAGGQLISPSRASVAGCLAGLFRLSRERFVVNAKNAVPNRALLTSTLEKKIKAYLFCTTQYIRILVNIIHQIHTSKLFHAMIRICARSGSQKKIEIKGDRKILTPKTESKQSSVCIHAQNLRL